MSGKHDPEKLSDLSTEGASGRLRRLLPRLSPAELTGFLLLWVMVGFSTGTSTLIGPVRWVVRRLRPEDSRATENLAVDAIIALFVLASAAIALWLTRGVTRSPYRHVRFGIPLLATGAAGGALWLWMTPGSFGNFEPEERAAPGSRFTFGPYPTEPRLRELKLEGYTAVITLLHPAVVPFEPKLLLDETHAAGRVGIELIHLPMLPWISENTDALRQIKELAKARKGRYYVHCYLGMDRVHLVRRIVEQAEPSVQVEALQEGRTLRRKSFERGDLYWLEDQVLVTPYPTDAEFMTLLRGMREFVSLLDPANPEDVRWIERERALLARYETPLRLMPLSLQAYDPYKVLEAARAVRGLPKPLAVHAYLSPSTGRSPMAEAFIQAYRTNRPPLPPSLFKDPMETGPVTVIAPHIAAGPRPMASDWAGYLWSRGIRAALFLGDGAIAEAQEDSVTARAAGLSWQAAGESGRLETLARGGPWYLYGPLLPAMQRRIARRFGPPVPQKTRWDPETLPEAERPPSGLWAVLVDFLRRAVPNPTTVILLGPPLLLATVLAGGLAAWLRVGRGVRAPYTRKVFHFEIFTLAGVLQLLGGLPAVTLFGSIVSLAVLYAVFRGDAFPFYEAMARPTDAPRRTLFIVVPLVTTALGGVLANLFFPPFAHIGYLVGGWGDAVGEPVGTAWGRRRYTVPSLAGVRATRSLEGSAAVMVMGVAASFLGLLAGGVGVATASGAAAACGIVGAVVEAVSNHGLDNLTVQVAAAGTAYWLVQ